MRSTGTIYEAFYSKIYTPASAKASPLLPLLLLPPPLPPLLLISCLGCLCTYACIVETPRGRPGTCLVCLQDPRYLGCTPRQERRLCCAMAGMGPSCSWAMTGQPVQCSQCLQAPGRQQEEVAARRSLLRVEPGPERLLSSEAAAALHGGRKGGGGGREVGGQVIGSRMISIN